MGLLPKFQFAFFLLVYEKARYFCVLILYPAISLNLFISSSSFWWHLWILWALYHTMWKYWKFYVFFSRLFANHFLPLLWLTRSPKTTLNNSGNSGHLCFIHDLREHVSRFPESCLLWVNPHMAFIMVKMILIVHFLYGFYHKWVLNFVKSCIWMYILNRFKTYPWKT